MFRKKIVYRLFIIFLVFACTFIIPLFIRININMDSVLSKYERVPADVRPNISQLRTDLNYKMFDDIAVMSFYSFFIAFLLSLFFSRKIVLPIRRLSQGAEAVRKGNFDVELPVMFNDELGEVTETFNRMARAIKEDTGELKKKDLYIRAMMDAMCILDAGDMIIDINPAFSKLFGYEKDDIADMSAYDLLDDENALIMRHEVDTSRVKGVSSSNQISIMSKTGENIPALITLSPITGEHQFDGTVMVIKDFREQANLINRLLESKKHLETIMNSIEDKMLLIDREYRIINANRSAFEVYGDDIIGRKCYSVGHDESKPCWTDGGDCPSKQVLENGNIARTIHEHKDRRGVSHYDEIVACPVRDMDGETIYVVELMRDVTESRKYEETISRKNRELATLNEISAMLSSSLKVDTIFAEVVAKLKDILDMDGGGVYLLDEDRKALNCVYHEGVSEDFAQMRGRIRIGEDIPGRVAVTGEGIMVQDVSRDYRIDRSILRFSGIKGYSCSPIRGKEKILGVICLFSFREHFFTEEEQRILMSAGKMAGLAADNINLYEKVKWLFEEQRKRRIREQRVLLEFAAAVSTFTDKRELLVFAVDLVMDYFNSTAAWFALVSDSGEITLDVIKGVEMEDEEKALPKGVYSIENAVAVSGDYLINSDILKEKQYYIPEVITRNSFRTVVSVPVKVSGRVYGVISLLYRRIASIEEEDLHFLLVVSSILSVSIETADLYEKRIMDRGLAEAVFDSMSEGVCTVNTDGIVTSVNRALVNILNMPAASVVDRHFTDVLPHEDGTKVCPVGKSLQGERSDTEATIQGPGGGEKTIHISSSPLVDINGRIRGAVQIIRDVTKSKKIDKLKSELVRRVSHEFRTPLSAIVGMAEMLLSGDVSGRRAREYLGTIHDEGTRLSSMVSDLLNLSKIENGKAVLNVTEIKIRDLINDLMMTFENAISEKSAKLNFSVETHLDSFHADNEKIKQILINIIHNALTYSDKYVIINVSVKKEHENVIFQVKDNGWGMTNEDLIHIGEKFFRGSLSGKIKGTGLGLVLCKELVNMHNGFMGLESSYKEGTTVTVSIPLKREINA